MPGWRRSGHSPKGVQLDSLGKEYLWHVLSAFQVYFLHVLWLLATYLNEQRTTEERESCNNVWKRKLLATPVPRFFDLAASAYEHRSSFQTESASGMSKPEDVVVDAQAQSDSASVLLLPSYSQAQQEAEELAARQAGRSQDANIAWSRTRKKPTPRDSHQLLQLAIRTATDRIIKIDFFEFSFFEKEL